MEGFILETINFIQKCIETFFTVHKIVFKTSYIKLKLNKKYGMPYTSNNQKR